MLVIASEAKQSRATRKTGLLRRGVYHWAGPRPDPLAPRNDERWTNQGETKMKNPPFDLTGKVAVITGSSRGIGRSSAELLARLGAKVVISSRKVDACQQVAEGIRKTGGDAHVIPCNISRREE